LVERYDDASPFASRLLTKAAQFSAIETMTLDMVGIDAKATPRRATALALAVSKTLAQLDANGFKRERRPLDDLHALQASLAGGQSVP
jgi:hypothetical protein